MQRRTLMSSDSGKGKSMKMRYMALLPLFAASALLPPLAQAQAPVFVISPPPQSTIKFNVKASVAIEGTFDKWDATLTFTSPNVTTAVLDIKIQAASVNTGSGMKDANLNGKDFFSPQHYP